MKKINILIILLCLILIPINIQSTPLESKLISGTSVSQASISPYSSNIYGFYIENKEGKLILNSINKEDMASPDIDDYNIITNYQEAKKYYDLGVSNEEEYNKAIEKYKKEPLSFTSNDISQFTKNKIYADKYSAYLSEYQTLINKCSDPNKCSKEEKDKLTKLQTLTLETPINVILKDQTLEQNQVQSLKDGLIKKECSDSWIISLCEITKSNILTEKYKSDFSNAIKASEQQMIKNNPNDANVLSFNTEVLNKFTTEMNNYFPNSVSNECKTDLSKCKSDLDKIKTSCESKGIECYEKLKNLNAGYDIANDESYVKTNAGFSILSLLQVSDKSAKAVSQLFGWDKQFSLIDESSPLAQSMASNICRLKYQGYFDKTSQDDGYGLTNYETNYTTNSKEITFDIRAQMTPIAPDNTVALSYSYYFKNNGDNDEQIQVGMTYSTSKGTKKVILKDKTTVSKKGGVSSDYGYEIIPLNGTGINENSFQIKLGTKSGRIYSYPVIVIRSGDKAYSGGGNSAGNEQAQSNSGNSGGTSNDDFI